MKSTVLKCLIVDDEPLAIKLMQRHVEQMPGLELISTFQNPLEAYAFLKNESIDLVFLDIQMPVLTGLDFVKSLQNPPAIIFTTAYRNYAVESYELDIVDYLVKPISFNRFFKAVNKFTNQKNTETSVNSSSFFTEVSSPTHIYVNANKKHIKVNFEEILYVESIKDYVRIHTLDNSIMTKDKISKFEKKLSLDFLRIHRSFIVNTNKITAFTAQDVEIGEREIPIGGSYKELVYKRLK